MRLALLAAACLLAACGGGGSMPQQAPLQAVKAAPQPCRGVGYGDSIMRGYYATPAGIESYLSDPWSAALPRLVPGFTFEDRSVPGQNMRNVVEGFTHPDPKWGYVPAFNLQSRVGFDVVVLESGVIDAWLIGMDPQGMRIAGLVDYYQQLQAIHRQVSAEGLQLVITGLARQHVFPDGHPQRFITPVMDRLRGDFDDLARRYAAENDVPFADIGAARFDGAADMLDAVHPGQAYSSRMAERIAGAVGIACQRAGK